MASNVQIAITKYTVTSAAGIGVDALRASLADRKSGLRQNDIEGCDLDTWIGRVAGVETTRLPAQVSHLQSRNNQLAWMGLQQDGFLDAVSQLSAQIGPDRIGVIMGTSTSSIGRTEEAYTQLQPSGKMSADYQQPEVHNLHSPGLFVAEITGLQGPSITLSTACSSSAKVFASASRWIRHGVVDAVLIGGVDSLCLSILYGFNSLELVSKNPCRPFDRRRDGISLGEAAGFALLVREDLAKDARFTILGYGESSDAHHMSSPHPEGAGAIIAIDRALERAGAQADAIDYINLHGTASKANDLVETYALAKRFPENTPVSSTKGWTGHTLGAAGILESIIAIDTMETGLIPGTLNCEDDDPDFHFSVLKQNLMRPIRHAMTTSFGFGGNNAALVFGRLND